MNEDQIPQVRMKANGDLVLRAEGQDTPLGNYNRQSGHLEYETREFSVKYHTQVVSRIGTIEKGKQASGLVIRSFGVKGEKRAAEPKSKRPRLGAAGDAAYEYVKWMIENDLPQAIIRYGIFTDANGQPVRRYCEREVKETVDAREEMDDTSMASREAHAMKADKGKEVGPVYQKRRIISDKKGIVARRGTDEGPDGEPPLTFSAAEVIGGFQADDYDEAEPQGPVTVEVDE